MEKQFESIVSPVSLPEYLRYAMVHYPANEELSHEIESIISDFRNEFGIRIIVLPLTPEPGYPNVYELTFANGPWISRPFAADFKEAIVEFKNYLVKNF